jgi:hypothetical protein
MTRENGVSKKVGGFQSPHSSRVQTQKKFPFFMLRSGLTGNQTQSVFSYTIALPFPEYFPTTYLAILITRIFGVITFTSNKHTGLIDICHWRGKYQHAVSREP